MLDKLTLPNSCIECKEADCMGYCKRLEDRQEDYALRRHKECPLEKEEPDGKR